MSTRLEESPLEAVYHDPPPAYKIFDDGTDIEAQATVTAPAPALVVESRGLAPGIITPTPTVTVVETTAAGAVAQPGAIKTIPPKVSSFAQTLATVIWLATIVYFFVTTRRAHVAAEHDLKVHYWCHSYNGSNLVTMLTFLIFAVGARLLCWLRKRKMGFLIWPIAGWFSLLAGMGIKGSVCGNWGSV